MDLLNELKKELDSIKYNFNESKKLDIKTATKLIKNENKDLSYNINILYKNNSNDTDQLISRIIVTFNIAVNKTYEILNDLIENTTKLIIHLLKENKIYDKELKTLEVIYNKSIKELDNLNNKFIKTMEHNYDLFIEGKDNRYILIINEGKYKLIYNLSNILNKKNDIKKIFKYNIIPFIKYIKDNKVNTKEEDNNKYFINLYDDYSSMILKGYKEDIDSYINNRLDVLNLKIKRINKKNNTKEITKLKNYLLNFNKELFIKNNDILIEMSNILKIDNGLKELKKYSKKLDKIYIISYKFDKVFNEYKENVLSILLNNKSYDEINKLIKEEEEEIEKYFSIKNISLFKDIESYLNSLIYKTLLASNHIDIN